MNYPLLRPLPSGNFRVAEPYEIKGYRVPDGFETDGLTLKVRLLRLVVDKYQPKFAPFFVLHDWLCSLDRYEEADRTGSEILFEIEDSWRTKVMMAVVKLYHKIKYNKG